MLVHSSRPTVPTLPLPPPPASRGTVASLKAFSVSLSFSRSMFSSFVQRVPLGSLQSSENALAATHSALLCTRPPPLPLTYPHQTQPVCWSVKRFFSSVRDTAPALVIYSIVGSKSVGMGFQFALIFLDITRLGHLALWLFEPLVLAERQPPSTPDPACSVAPGWGKETVLSVKGECF